MNKLQRFFTSADVSKVDDVHLMGRDDGGMTEMHIKAIVVWL